MELGFLRKKRENHLTNKKNTITGTISLCLALLAMFLLNIGLVSKTNYFSLDLIFTTTQVSLVFGVIGLITRKNRRTYAIWALSLCLFIFLFSFLMIGLSWMINPKP